MSFNVASNVMAIIGFLLVDIGGPALASSLVPPYGELLDNSSWRRYSAGALHESFLDAAK